MSYKECFRNANFGVLKRLTENRLQSVLKGHVKGVNIIV